MIKEGGYERILKGGDKRRGMGVDGRRREAEVAEVEAAEGMGGGEGWYYRGRRVELDKFLRFHPGGSKSLVDFWGKDLKAGLEAAHHSSNAYHLLRDILGQEDTLVDWSKPMFSQVGGLGKKYKEWVWKPVDRPLRLFSWELAERLTRTNWKQVVAVWVPVILFAYSLSLRHSPYPIIKSILLTSTAVIIGMGVWPLLEYCIHRWLFHLEPPDNSPLLIKIHFSLHGLHHKVPFDEGRLLFPPGPASVMAASIYYLYSYLLPWWLSMAAFSGTLLGYLTYDLIHFYLHHGNPSDGTYLYNLKRHHNQHHFAQRRKGFGISSNFWDHAFNSLTKLRTLQEPLTWDPRIINKSD